MKLTHLAGIPIRLCT
ncbi:hypothetical protein VULLAG_LOCUS5701 [Vulpes lagopus]